MGYYSHFEKLYYIRFYIVTLVFVSRLSPEILRRQNRLPWLRFALVCLLHTPTKFHEPTGNKYTITLKQTEYNIVSSKGMVISPAKVTPSNISRRNFFNIPSTMFDMQFNEGVTAQLKKSILNLGLKIVNLVFVRHLLFQTVGRQNRHPWLRFALVCIQHTPPSLQTLNINKYTITLNKSKNLI